MVDSFTIDIKTKTSLKYLFTIKKQSSFVACFKFIMFMLFYLFFRLHNLIIYKCLYVYYSNRLFE